VIIHCFAGCDPDDVLEALGATWRDFWPGGSPPPERRFRAKDRTGKPHGAHQRYYDGRGEKQGGWVGHDRGATQMPLYGAEKLKGLPSGGRIFLTEGETACEALWKRGVAAVGTMTGSGAIPCNNSLRDLRKFKVILWPDNDGVGRSHMENIAQHLTDLGIEHAWLEWSDAPPKGDADDYFAYGGTVEGLESLICEHANCEESELSPGQEDNSHTSHFAISHRAPPKEMGKDAYHGLVGEIVRAVEPHTEADPAGLIVQLLALFGALVGRTTYFQVSGTRHYLLLFANLVGDTARGRKGMAWGVVRHVFSFIAEVNEWLQTNVLGGLSSGEGLIHAVSDYEEDEEEVELEGDRGKKKRPAALPTQADKRVLVYESEFSSVLKMPARDGNTLSEVIRRAWDGDVLQTLTKGSPERATGAHIAIVGNITAEEISRHLSETDRANGLANRFLWIYVKRARLLPDGGDLTKELLQPLADKLQTALSFAQGLSGHVMTRDQAARELWHQEYPGLSEGYPGMLGAMTARAVPQVMRLACIYALLDQSQVVKVEHLKAALAVWAYAEDSVRYIFGDVLGDPVADTILRALRHARTDGMTRTEMTAGLFGRHIKADQLTRGLDLLREHNLVRAEKKSTGGRAEERWFAILPQDGAQPQDDAKLRNAKKANEFDTSHNSQFATSPESDSGPASTEPDLEERDGDSWQPVGKECPQSPTGYHEYAQLRASPRGPLLCVHCEQPQRLPESEEQATPPHEARVWAEAVEIPSADVAPHKCPHPHCDSTRFEWWDEGDEGDERGLHCYRCGKLVERATEPKSA
jgi:hypothetical protein